MFGEKWNSKWLNKNVLRNHCEWTHFTQKGKSEQKRAKRNENLTFESKIIIIENRNINFREM